MSLSCVVINLDSMPRRLARMEKRLAVLDYPWRRFSAITPDRVTMPFERDCSPAMQACAQSHYEVWRQIQTTPGLTLICEDDVMFRKDAAQIIPAALRDIATRDNEWHAFFLNHGDALLEHETWQPIKYNTATGAYILSPRGLTLLIERFAAGLSLADAMTGWWLQPLGHSYGYFPWLAIQEHLDSGLQTIEHSAKDRQRRDALLAKANCSVFNYF